MRRVPRDGPLCYVPRRRGSHRQSPRRPEDSRRPTWCCSGSCSTAGKSVVSRPCCFVLALVRLPGTSCPWLLLLLAAKRCRLCCCCSCCCYWFCSSCCCCCRRQPSEQRWLFWWSPFCVFWRLFIAPYGVWRGVRGAVIINGTIRDRSVWPVVAVVHTRTHTHTCRLCLLSSLSFFFSSLSAFACLLLLLISLLYTNDYLTGKRKERERGKKRLAWQLRHVYPVKQIKIVLFTSIRHTLPLSERSFDLRHYSIVYQLTKQYTHTHK